MIFCKKTSVEKAVETGKINFDFQDGESIVFDINKVPDETIALLALHGASQKIGDGYAGAKGDFESGRKVANAIIDNLYKGDWRAAREAGEPRISLLIEALALATGETVEASTGVIEGMDKQARSDLSKDDAIKVAKNTITLQRNQAKLEKATERKDLKSLF